MLILPVGPVPQYTIAARLINQFRLSCRHLVTFNMDEYADENGHTAPPDWEGSFATAMRENFFLKLDDDLRPLPENIHFPDTGNVSRYSEMIAEAGEADCSTAASAGADTSLSGRPIWARSSAMTWRPTGRPGPGWSR